MRRITKCLTVLVMGAVIGSFASEAGEKKEPKVKKTELGKMPNASAFADIIFGGQPSEEDLKAAKARGIKAGLNLREEPELDFDEAKLVKDLGLKYHHVPFQGVAKLTDDVFDKVRVVLKDKESRPLRLHCHAANRVGAVWLAHRVLDHKVDFKDALKEAKTIGLKTEAYVDRAKEYIERQKK